MACRGMVPAGSAPVVLAEIGAAAIGGVAVILAGTSTAAVMAGTGAGAVASGAAGWVNSCPADAGLAA